MIFDYNKLSRHEKKHWRECLCDDTLGAIDNDGLLFMFAIADIQHLINRYPRRGEEIFFNDTFDRAIGEFVGYGMITVNPQFVYQNFKEILT